MLRTGDLAGQLGSLIGPGIRPTTAVTAIFSQVVGTIRDDGATRDQHKANTLILYASKFHWAWFIPLDEDVVSVGIVVPSAYFLEKKESLRDFYIRELHEIHPELKRRIPEIKLVESVHVIPNYSFQVKSLRQRLYLRWRCPSFRGPDFLVRDDDGYVGGPARGATH